MSIIVFVLLALAVWRVSNLIANETGPFHMFKKFRIYVRALCIFGPLHGVRFFCDLHAYELLQCEYCNSIWLAFPVALLYAPEKRLVIPLWLSLSTTTIFLKSIKEMVERIHSLPKEA